MSAAWSNHNVYLVISLMNELLLYDYLCYHIKEVFLHYRGVWRCNMPKSSNQKLKLIYLMKIFLERTDETHSITMPEIIDALAAYDISAERKSLYNDIENLRVYGLDVIGTQEDRRRL